MLEYFTTLEPARHNLGPIFHIISIPKDDGTE